MLVPVLDSQVVPSNTWTWSTVDDDLALYHDHGYDEVVVTYEDGSVRVRYPELWVFVRWDRRERRWQSTSAMEPSREFTIRALERFT